jgi:membrane protein implicated in regulation of membrane protease activity
MPMTEIWTIISDILNGMDVPFQTGFVVVLAIVLYAVGQRTKKKLAPDAKIDAMKIPMRNMIFGSVASTGWYVLTYFLSNSVITLIFTKWIIMGVLSGIIAAALATIVHEVLKNKLNISIIRQAEATPTDPEPPTEDPNVPLG